MIGPDLTTVRERRSAAYAAIIGDPQRVVPGGLMPRIVMPASTRELIVGYLGSQPGNAPDASIPAVTPPAAELDPSLAVANFYAGRLLLDLGNPREALRRIETGLRFDPSATDARQMRDQLRGNIGRQP